MSDGLSRECEKLREQLPEHAEGKLGGRLRARVEKHLAQCARCAAELEQVRVVIQAVRGVPSEATPDDLVDRVRRAVRESAPAPPVPTQLWARVAVPVAVLTAVVAIGFALRVPGYRGPTRTAALKTEAAARGGAPAQPPFPGRRRSSAPPTIEIAEARQPEVMWQPREHTWTPRERDDASAADATSAASLERESPPAAVPSKQLGSAREGGPAAVEGRRATAPPGSVRVDGRSTGRVPQARVRGGEMGRAAEKAQPYAIRNHAKARGMPGGRGGSFSEPATQAEETAPPPFTAIAALRADEGRPRIVLDLGVDRPSPDEITVTLGRAGERRVLYRGVLVGALPVVLPSEEFGPGPTTVPITIESRTGRRDYVLFVPTMARLGESAPLAPVGRFEDKPVFDALADFSALTGLVVLAEEPLSDPFAGEIPPGPPAASLERLADSMGFEVEREGDLVLTLTHPR